MHDVTKTKNAIELSKHDNEDAVKKHEWSQITKHACQHDNQRRQS